MQTSLRQPLRQPAAKSSSNKEFIFPCKQKPVTKVAGFLFFAHPGRLLFDRMVGDLR
jgi:hypothetical protein